MLPLKQVYHQEKQMLLTARPTMPDTLRLFAPPMRPRQFHLWPTLALWRERRRTRQHLSTLNERELADVGLSRTQQRVECAKAFWRL